MRFNVPTSGARKQQTSTPPRSKAAFPLSSACSPVVPLRYGEDRVRHDDSSRVDEAFASMPCMLLAAWRDTHLHGFSMASVSRLLSRARAAGL